MFRFVKGEEAAGAAVVEVLLWPSWSHFCASVEAADRAGIGVFPSEEGPLEPVAVEAAHGLHILSGFELHFLQAG